ELLRSGGTPPVDLLLTFGSGLRKLEELRFVLEERNFRQSAALTLVGLVATGLFGYSSVRAAVSPALTDAGSRFVTVGMAVAGAVLLVAGLRDMASGPGEERLRAWGQRLAGNGVARWRDVYSSADPVPNGALLGDGDHPESIEVT